MKFDDETEREVDLVRRSYRRGTDGFALRGTAGDLEELLRTLPVDEVYLAGNAHKHGDEMQEAIRVCEKYGIPFALPAYAFRLERARPVEAEAISDGYLHYQNVQVMPGQHSLKRLFDILSSAVALWLLLPLLATVSLLIRVSSRGPVFFRQERVGLRGRRFSMLKFRSMVVDAESPPSAASSASTRSTSCPSWSTSCAAT